MAPQPLHPPALCCSRIRCPLSKTRRVTSWLLQELLRTRGVRLSMRPGPLLFYLHWHMGSSAAVLPRSLRAEPSSAPVYSCQTGLCQQHCTSGTLNIAGGLGLLNYPKE